MDLSGVRDFFTEGVANKILIWTIGSAVSIFVGNGIRNFLQRVSDHAILKIKAQIATIQDENLKEAARHVVRYISTQMPNDTGNKKLEEAIRTLQDITPDILVSDDKLRVIIESAYLDFKSQLKQV